MKQSKAFSSLAISILIVFLATSCSSDDEPTKTPVSLDTWSIAFGNTSGTVYFTEGDELHIVATAKSDGPNYKVTYVYNAHTPWEYDSGDILYYENLNNGNDFTHNFTAECGNPEVVTDQRTVALFHQADYIKGQLNLTRFDETAKFAGTLTRQHILIDITLEPDDDSWGTGEFVKWFADRKDDIIILITGGYTITPLINMEADGSSVNIRAIAPLFFAGYSEWHVLNIPPEIGADPSTESHELLVNTDGFMLHPGDRIEISARYKQSGVMENIKVAMKEWMIYYDGE